MTEPALTVRWEARKLQMIERLRRASLATKLVAAADKYHNLNHTWQNQQKRGAAVWERFGRGEAQQAWYYRNITESILANVAEPERYPIFGRLISLVNELFAGIESHPPEAPGL
jgi:hypothetical protein